MRAAGQFLLRPQNLLGLLLVLTFASVALAAPRLAPRANDPSIAPDFRRIGRRTDATPHPPDAEALFGTLPGQLDIYYTVVWGTPSALKFGIVVAACTATLGVLLGAASGYAGGWMQRLTVPVIDAFLAFPAIAGYWVIRYSMFPSTPSLFTTSLQRLVSTLQLDPLMVALILFSWMPYARITNSSTIRLRQIEYVQAARALGAGPLRVIARHIVPNLAAPILVLAARDVGGTVMLAAAFTFIGVGGDLPWGTLLAIGRDWIIGPGGSLTAYWWVYLPVTAALLLFGIGWNLLGDGLNDLVAGRRSSTLPAILRRRSALVTATLVLGFALGLAYSWLIDPVRLQDATPAQLSREFQRDYLRMTIDSLSTNLDISLALQRFHSLEDFAARTLGDLGVGRTLAERARLRGFEYVLENVTPTTDSLAQRTSPLAPGLGLALALAGGAGLAATILLVRLARGRKTPAVRSDSPRPASSASALPQVPPAAPAARGMALSTFRVTYTHTDALLDQAFVLETPDGEFLGECGVAATDGVRLAGQEPPHGLQVWLFDRQDLRTTTMVLASPAALQDPALRAALSEKGEPIPIENGSLISLDARSLILDARVMQIAFQPGFPTATAAIQQASLELRAWRRASHP